jgi:hypothetical protein
MLSFTSSRDAERISSLYTSSRAIAGEKEVEVARAQ